MTAPPGSMPSVPAAASSAQVWVDRTGPGRYSGHNDRAHPVPIGMAGANGCFSPTELLQVALAGCAGLAAEHLVTRRLGEDAEVRIAVVADHDATQGRFTALSSTMTVDLSGLDPQTQDRLRAAITRAVHRYCTVGRTLEHGALVPIALREPA